MLYRTNPGGLINLENLKNAGRKLLHPLVGLLAALGMGPFSVTILGLLMTAVAAWFIWDGKFIVGVAFFIVGSILDAVDGALARKKNVVSKAGAVFDSCCDRIGEILIFGAILAGKAGEAHHVMVYLVPAAIGGSYMVSYIRARAEGVNLSCSVGAFTRTERLILLMVGLVTAGLWGTQALVITMIVLSAGTWFTAGQRFAKVFRDGREISLDKK